MAPVASIGYLWSACLKNARVPLSHFCECPFPLSLWYSLTKLEPGRPYYRKPAKNSPDSLCLLDHSFIIDHGLRLDNKEFDMVGWWQSVLHNPDEEG